MFLRAARKLSVNTRYTFADKSVKIVGYADDINILGKRLEYIRAGNNGRDVGLRINEKKTKVMFQTRRGRRQTETPNEGSLQVAVVSESMYLDRCLMSNNMR